MCADHECAAMYRLVMQFNEPMVNDQGSLCRGMGILKEVANNPQLPEQSTRCASLTADSSCKPASLPPSHTIIKHTAKPPLPSFSPSAIPIDPPTKNHVSHSLPPPPHQYPSSQSTLTRRIRQTKHAPHHMPDIPLGIRPSFASRL